MDLSLCELSTPNLPPFMLEIKESLNGIKKDLIQTVLTIKNKQWILWLCHGVLYAC